MVRRTNGRRTTSSPVAAIAKAARKVKPESKATSSRPMVSCGRSTTYTGPFPEWKKPTEEDCRAVTAALVNLHGYPEQANHQAASVGTPKTEGPARPKAHVEPESVKKEGKAPVKVTEKLLQRVKDEPGLKTSRADNFIQSETMQTPPPKEEAADTIEGTRRSRRVKREKDAASTPAIKRLRTEGSMSANTHLEKMSRANEEAQPVLSTPKFERGSKKLQEVKKMESKNGGACGKGENKTEVLDFLAGTILSQNTTDVNSHRAFNSLKAAFPTWDDVLNANPKDVEESIRSGGLAEIKTARLQFILQTLKEERGECSMEYVRDLDNDAIKAELGRFKGVGPKTVSCVLMFGLGRAEFPVDTHVWKIALALGWVPKRADREATYEHLNQIVPDDIKFALHVLLVQHGKEYKNDIRTLQKEMKRLAEHSD